MGIDVNGDSSPFILFLCVIILFCVIGVLSMSNLIIYLLSILISENKVFGPADSKLENRPFYYSHKACGKKYNQACGGAQLWDYIKKQE